MRGAAQRHVPSKETRYLCSVRRSNIGLWTGSPQLRWSAPRAGYLRGAFWCRPTCESLFASVISRALCLRNLRLFQALRVGS